MALTKAQIAKVLNKATRKLIQNHLFIRSVAPSKIASTVEPGLPAISIPTLVRLGLAQDDVVLPLHSQAANIGNPPTNTDYEILNSTVLGSSNFRVGKYDVYGKATNLEANITPSVMHGVSFNPRFILDIQTMPDEHPGFMKSSDLRTVKNITVNLSDAIYTSKVFTYLDSLNDPGVVPLKAEFQTIFRDKLYDEIVTSFESTPEAAELVKILKPTNNNPLVLRKVLSLISAANSKPEWFTDKIINTLWTYTNKNKFKTAFDIFTKIAKFSTKLAAVYEFKINTNGNMWELESKDVYGNLTKTQQIKGSAIPISLLHSKSGNSATNATSTLVYLSRNIAKMKHYLTFMGYYFKGEYITNADEVRDRLFTDIFPMRKEFHLFSGNTLYEDGIVKTTNEWDPSVEYAIDSRVLYSENIYTAINSTKGAIPSSSPSDWGLIQELDSFNYRIRQTVDMDYSVVPPLELFSIKPGVDSEILIKAKDASELAPLSYVLGRWKLSTTGNLPPSDIAPITVTYNSKLARSFDNNLDKIPILESITEMEVTVPGRTNSIYKDGFANPNLEVANAKNLLLYTTSATETKLVQVNTSADIKLKLSDSLPNQVKYSADTHSIYIGYKYDESSVVSYVSTNIEEPHEIKIYQSATIELQVVLKEAALPIDFHKVYEIIPGTADNKITMQFRSAIEKQSVKVDVDLKKTQWIAAMTGLSVTIPFKHPQIIIPFTISEANVIEYTASLIVKNKEKQKDDFFWDKDIMQELEKAVEIMLNQEVAILGKRKDLDPEWQNIFVNDNQVMITDRKPFFDPIDTDSGAVFNMDGDIGYAKYSYQSNNTDISLVPEPDWHFTIVGNVVEMMTGPTPVSRHLRKGMRIKFTQGTENLTANITEITGSDTFTIDKDAPADKFIHLNEPEQSKVYYHVAESIKHVPILNIYYPRGGTSAAIGNVDDKQGNIPRTANAIMTNFITKYMTIDDVKNISHIVGYADDQVPDGNTISNLHYSWTRAVSAALHCTQTLNTTLTRYLLGGLISNNTQAPINISSSNFAEYSYISDADPVVTQTEKSNANLAVTASKIAEMSSPVPFTLNIGYDINGNEVANIADGKTVQIYGVSDRQPVSLNDAELTKRFNRRTEIWRECIESSRDALQVKSYVDALNMHLIEPLSSSHMPIDVFLHQAVPLFSVYTQLENSNKEKHRTPTLDAVDINYFNKIITPSQTTATVGTPGQLFSDRKYHFDNLGITYQSYPDAYVSGSTRVFAPAIEMPMPLLFKNASSVDQKVVVNNDVYLHILYHIIHANHILGYHNIMTMDTAHAPQLVHQTLEEMKEKATIKRILEPRITGTGNYAPDLYTRVAGLQLNDPRTIDVESILKDDVIEDDISSSSKIIISGLKYAIKKDKKKDLTELANVSEHLAFLLSDFLDSILRQDIKSEFQLLPIDSQLIRYMHKDAIGATLDATPFPSISVIYPVDTSIPLPFIEMLRSGEYIAGTPANILSAKLRWIMVDMYGTRGLTYNPIVSIAHKEDPDETQTEVISLNTAQLVALANSADMKEYPQPNDSHPSVSDLIQNENLDVTSDAMRTDARFNKIPSVYSVRFTLLNRPYQPQFPFMDLSEISTELKKKEDDAEIISFGEMMAPTPSNQKRYAKTATEIGYIV